MIFLQRRLRCLALILGVLLATVIAAPLPATAQTTPTSIPGSRLDLNGDSLIDGADAADVVVVVNDLRADGVCIYDVYAEQDVNGDGCVDVQDIQAVLGQWGQLADPSKATDQVGTAAGPIITVNSTGDGGDADGGEGACATTTGSCTLRAAIETANEINGPAEIRFAIDCPGSALKVINPLSELEVAGDGQTTIDGYSQCGASPNTGTIVGNAVLKIEIRGKISENTGPGGEGLSDSYGVSGIVLESPFNVIKGLSVVNFDRDIRIQGEAANNNSLQGNWVGLTTAQASSLRPDESKFPTEQSRRENRFQGVFITGKAHHNVVGCGSYIGSVTWDPCDTQAEFNAARNIISGNDRDGLQLEGSTDASTVPSFNRVVGNYVGLKQDGKSRLQNRTDGVDFNNNVQDNWLGGELFGPRFGGNPGERNVITGNSGDGIELSHGASSLRNRIVGNWFGIDANGQIVPPGNTNTNCGISLEESTQQTQVYDNVLSNNAGCGIRLQVNVRQSEIFNNNIGVGPDGFTPMPNGVKTAAPYPDGRMGVFIYGGSTNNIVRNNIIANNPDQGVLIDSSNFEPWESRPGYPFETRYNTVSQNSIYNNGAEGIKLGTNDNPDPGGIQDYIANDYIARPEILTATQVRVTGTAKKDRRSGQNAPCVGCRVELFIAETGTGGEGRTFVGSAITEANGSWTINTCGEVRLATTDKVVATTTDINAGLPGYGNTSDFGGAVAVAAEVCAGPTPTQVPTATPIIGTPPPPTATPPVSTAGPTVTPTVPGASQPGAVTRRTFVPGVSK